MKDFSQIYTKELGSNIMQIFVKQNNFLAGEVDKSEGIFYSIPRSNKNLFHLFHGAEGGLGINEEILLRPDFDLMKIKFCDKILTTSRLKWLNRGIVSPYCNQIVDKQIILKLSEINLDDVEKYQPSKVQINLFEVEA
ncbi:hypothetical protein C0389_00330 [bacterium]|nr:hypothetical protein [bacterium]